jgi:hypothetical protein
MGGSEDRDDGCTNPPVLTLPSVTRPQSLPQGLLENAGPAGAFAFALRQQHFARPRQQHEADELNELAASGAREANDRSRARLTAITARTKRRLSLVPSIPWKAVYHCTLLLEGASFCRTLGGNMCAYDSDIRSTNCGTVCLRSCSYPNLFS